jgi:hypothetical protein
MIAFSAVRNLDTDMFAIYSLQDDGSDLCSGSLGLDRSQSVVASVQYKEVPHAHATSLYRQV